MNLPPRCQQGADFIYNYPETGRPLRALTGMARAAGIDREEFMPVSRTRYTAGPLAHRAIRFVATALLLLALQPVQAAGPIDARLAGDLVEHHAPEVAVSGNVIVGVMAASASRALAQDLLAIRAPDSGSTTICLKVTSRDGTYTSRNEYSSDSAPAVLRLPYRSRLEEVLEQYTGKPGHIAITASRGNCVQSAPADYYLPSVVDAKTGELDSAPLSIFINGFDATDVYYRIAGANEISDCHYIEEGRHTAYNFSCEIAEVPGGTSLPLTVEIMREVYGRELEPLTIRILATR
jgi:hypothetical protein